MQQTTHTPMMKQYLGIKEKYTDALLFYRMGDFYEMFNDDAVEAARLLEITLTSRDKKSENPTPMCGVPVKAAEGYIAKLIGNGRKVAVCEQVENAQDAKGLVRREVVRVVTPGMVLDGTLLDEKSNNFILSIAVNGKNSGIAYLDISTGTFKVVESPNNPDIIKESIKVGPSELICPENLKNNDDFSELFTALQHRSVTFLDDASFDYKKCRENLVDHFQTRSLEGFGCDHLNAGIKAAGALLTYVRETQFGRVDHLDSLENYTLGEHLVLDDLSCRNLELTANIRNGSKEGTLLSVIDKTITSMGGRLLKEWLRYPLMDIARINERFDAVSEAREKLSTRDSLRRLLKNVYDLERLASKISMGQANARDLVAVKISLLRLPEIIETISTFESPLFRCTCDTDKLFQLAGLIDAAIREDAPLTLTEGGLIKDGYNDELDDYIRLTRDGKGYIAKLEISEKEKTGLSSLKVKYNKVFGYFIEVSKGQSKSVPEHYMRKQTLVNAERYITEELKDYETKVINAQEKKFSLEYDIFNTIRDITSQHTKLIMAFAAFTAKIDCIMNYAEIADHNNYVRPEFNTKGIIRIQDGRHPVVEKMISGERYVPNSVLLDNNDNQVVIITGPNMAGKSTVLRQVALIAVMGQAGSFVPAKEADLCITDRVFTRVGALDNLSQGQSTFMVEMEETANIMNNATPDSLVIMDEIGRGTSTFDGLSIAWAVAEYLHDLEGRGVKTLFATHYHELVELASIKKRVKNANIAVKESDDTIVFLRKLVDGGTNRSYGIQVARLAGIPKTIITRSKKVLDAVENNGKDSGDSFLMRLDGHNGTITRPKKNVVRPPVQMGLFGEPENPVLKKLRKIDVLNITPIQALSLLNELKEEVGREK
jgi:DNA mismatch repair protein MutS